MELSTTKWDPAEFLTSDEAIAAYLEAAFEDGDPKMIAVALGDIAKAKGMSVIAREALRYAHICDEAPSGQWNEGVRQAASV